MDPLGPFQRANEKSIAGVLGGEQHIYHNLAGGGLISFSFGFLLFLFFRVET